MGMEVRSSTNRSLVCGSPKVDCNGVKESMGLPSSVDPFPLATLGVFSSTTSDKGGVILLDLGGLPDLFSASVFLFCGGLSVSYRAFLGFPFFCASWSKPGGTLSCSWGRVISSP
jgi:hypothetical protein